MGAGTSGHDGGTDWKGLNQVHPCEHDGGLRARWTGKLVADGNADRYHSATRSTDQVRRRQRPADSCGCVVPCRTAPMPSRLSGGGVAGEASTPPTAGLSNKSGAVWVFLCSITRLTLRG